MISQEKGLIYSNQISEIFIGSIDFLTKPIINENLQTLLINKISPKEEDERNFAAAFKHM
jgi:hypothetical protein